MICVACNSFVGSAFLEFTKQMTKCAVLFNYIIATPFLSPFDVFVDE
jgi:hypothetical protein